VNLLGLNQSVHRAQAYAGQLRRHIRRYHRNQFVARPAAASNTRSCAHDQPSGCLNGYLCPAFQLRFRPHNQSVVPTRGVDYNGPALGFDAGWLDQRTAAEK